MPDELDAAIASARRDLDETRLNLSALQRQAEMLEVRLKALQEAAIIRPIRDDGVRPRTETQARGRQPGAISRTWRNVLAKVAAEHSDGAEEAEILEVARALGLSNIRLKDVRDRMRNYETQNYVEPSISGWKVTPFAQGKFTQDSSDQNDEEEAVGAENLGYSQQN